MCSIHTPNLITRHVGLRAKKMAEKKDIEGLTEESEKRDIEGLDLSLKEESTTRQRGWEGVGDENQKRADLIEVSGAGELMKSLVWRTR